MEKIKQIAKSLGSWYLRAVEESKGIWDGAYAVFWVVLMFYACVACIMYFSLWQILLVAMFLFLRIAISDKINHYEDWRWSLITERGIYKFGWLVALIVFSWFIINVKFAVFSDIRVYDTETKSYSQMAAVEYLPNDGEHHMVCAGVHFWRSVNLTVTKENYVYTIMASVGGVELTDNSFALIKERIDSGKETEFFIDGQIGTEELLPASDKFLAEKSVEQILDPTFDREMENFLREVYRAKGYEYKEFLVKVDSITRRPAAPDPAKT